MNIHSEQTCTITDYLQYLIEKTRSISYFEIFECAEMLGLQGAEIRRIVELFAARGLLILDKPADVGDTDSCGVPKPFFNPETNCIIAAGGIDALDFDKCLDRSVPKSQRICLTHAPQAIRFRDGKRSVNYARCLDYCERRAPYFGDIYEAARDTMCLPRGTLSRLLRKRNGSSAPFLSRQIIRHCMKTVVYLAAVYALRDGDAYLADYLTCGRAAAVQAVKEGMAAAPAGFRRLVRSRIEHAIVSWRSKAMRPTRCLRLNALYGYYARTCALILTRKTDALGNTYPDCDFGCTDEAVAQKALGGLSGLPRKIMRLRLGCRDGICHTCEEVCALCAVTRYDVQQAELAFLAHLPKKAA